MKYTVYLLTVLSLNLAPLLGMEPLEQQEQRQQQPVPVAVLPPTSNTLITIHLMEDANTFYLDDQQMPVIRTVPEKYLALSGYLKNALAFAQTTKKDFDQNNPELELEIDPATFDGLALCLAYLYHATTDSLTDQKKNLMEYFQQFGDDESFGNFADALDYFKLVDQKLVDEVMTDELQKRLEAQGLDHLFNTLLQSDNPEAFNPFGISKELNTQLAAKVAKKASNSLELKETLDQARGGHTDWVRSVAFSPDGTTLASGSDDNTINLWALVNGTWTCIHTLGGHAGSVFSVAFSHDGSTLASASRDYTIKLWALVNGTWACIQTLSGHTNWVNSVVFSPDGTTLASASRDNTIKLWALVNGTWACIQTLRGHTSSVSSVALSPDGTTLASGSDDKTIKLWALVNGTWTCSQTLPGRTSGVSSVAFSPDGTTLASGSWDRTIKLWALVNGACIQTLRGHTSGVSSVAFSPDGTTLASGSDDTTINLWALVNGACIQTLGGHTNWVRSVAFSPDSKILASGSADTTINLWARKSLPPLTLAQAIILTYAYQEQQKTGNPLHVVASHSFFALLKDLDLDALKDLITVTHESTRCPLCQGERYLQKKLDTVSKDTNNNNNNNNNPSMDELD